MAKLTLHGDVSTHHLAEPPAYDEAKAGAAVFACRGGGRLREFLEQLVHLLRCHPDAGVAYSERDPVAAILPFLLSGDGDTALLGELVGVARQIEQGLPEAGLVGEVRAEVRWAIDDEAVAVLRGHRLDGLGYVLD